MIEDIVLEKNSSVAELRFSIDAAVPPTGVSKIIFEIYSQEFNDARIDVVLEANRNFLDDYLLFSNDESIVALGRTTKIVYEKGRVQKIHYKMMGNAKDLAKIEKAMQKYSNEHKLTKKHKLMYQISNEFSPNFFGGFKYGFTESIATTCAYAFCVYVGAYLTVTIPAVILAGLVTHNLTYSRIIERQNRFEGLYANTKMSKAGFALGTIMGAVTPLWLTNSVSELFETIEPNPKITPPFPSYEA